MTSNPVVRAAAVQIAPDLNSCAGTLKKVLDTMDEAASEGVDLIV
ncbi:MAG TPA: aliphatic nitrilase, partial [Oceanospirillales bacterium]|nr:aliphatic nitrilase [Oceanospirillales bacterium]